MTDTALDAATGLAPLLDLIVIDCPDAVHLARFFSAVPGWEVEDESNRDWVPPAWPG
ncbi:MAG: VOC family protein [Propionibacteriaceae bacterium]